MAVSRAMQQAGGTTGDVAAVFIGMAGIVGEDDLKLGRSIVYSGVPGVAEERFGVDHDIRIALAGGLTGEEGVALIVGTGSSCYGRTRDGRSCQAGGWGSVLDDGGSAYGLGLAAMKAAVRIADGRLPESPLLEHLMKALELNEIRQIVDRVYRTGMSKAEVGSLAPMVMDLWRAGDGCARDIVMNEVHELVWIVEVAARRLGLKSPRVCYSGGLIENSGDYAAEVVRRVKEKMPGAEMGPAVLPPLLGAVLLAMDHAGARHGPEVWKTMRETLEARDLG
jgi:N-acetylglucosamine kinase-like BadF-type ATPase